MLRRPKDINPETANRLRQQATAVRKDVLRMIQNAGSGNPGSALSCVEILVWLLHYEMHLSRDDPRREARDRLILSKGHAAPVFYSICAQLGWIGQEELLGFRRFNTRLQTHPEYRTLPCVDYPSGSLGQGLSAANGMTLAARYQKKTDLRFFVLIGDGELQEGQIWEAAMTAGHHALENVVAVVDRNTLQGDRAVSDEMEVEPLADKWRAFGWEVAFADGHDFGELASAFRSMAEPKPKVIITATCKGKGISFMEGNNEWHVGGKKFTEKLLQDALQELGKLW